MKKWLNFGGALEPIRHADCGTDIARLVRRALAEVYTVPVLLVITIVIVNQYTLINYYSVISALLAKRVSKFESSFEKFILSMQ